MENIIGGSVKQESQTRPEQIDDGRSKPGSDHTTQRASTRTVASRAARWAACFWCAFHPVSAALTESADFVYKCTDYYHPDSEISLAWDDPALGIDWPIVEGSELQLSEKDRAGLLWQDCPLYRGLM